MREYMLHVSNGKHLSSPFSKCQGKIARTVTILLWVPARNKRGVRYENTFLRVSRKCLRQNVTERISYLLLLRANQALGAAGQKGYVPIAKVLLPLPAVTLAAYARVDEILWAAVSR